MKYPLLGLGQRGEGIAMRIRSFCLIVFLTMFVLAGGCPPSERNQVEDNVGEEGGTLTLGGATVVVPTGALPLSVLITLEQEDEGQQLALDENETPVSAVFRVLNDQQGVLDSEGDPFVLALPFDTSLVSDPLPSDVALLVKAEADEVETEEEEKSEKEEADKYEFLMMGTVVGGQIEILLQGLPSDARFQVVYNPYRIGIIDEEEDTSKTLTPLPPWETKRWYASVDANSALVRSTVATVLGISAEAVTTENIAFVIKRDVCRNARDAARVYEDAIMRAPNLDIHTCDDGKRRFVIHVSEQETNFMPPSSENGFGQLNVGCQTLTWTPSYRLGTVKGVIAHEMFHACLNGYELKTVVLPNHKRAYSGYNEGMATVLGHTIDKGGVISVRENSAGRTYFMRLNEPLGICDPARDCYRNNDFIAYVGKRYGGGSLMYLVGTGMDGDDDRNGILEQMRKHLNADASLVSGVSTAESFFEAYRRGLNTSFDLQFSSSLADVYWDFARNRAYENNEESRLRTGDPSTRWQLYSERFTLGTALFFPMQQEQTRSISSVGNPGLQSIEPFSTRALSFTGSGFTTNLTLTFDISGWTPDDLGNSVRVKVYKAGEDGFQLASGGNTITLEGFGDSFDQAVVLISNVSVDHTYSVSLTAATKPPEEPVECTPNEPSDRWLIQYDYDCNDTWDSDVLWHFLDDGRIQHHWLGIIEGYTWTVEDNKIIINLGSEDHRMEATFSEDCYYMEDGVFVPVSGSGTCWKARRY